MGEQFRLLRASCCERPVCQFLRKIITDFKGINSTQLFQYFNRFYLLKGLGEVQYDIDKDSFKGQIFISVREWLPLFFIIKFERYLSNSVKW